MSLFCTCSKSVIAQIEHNLANTFRLTADLNRKVDRLMSIVTDLQASEAKFHADFEAYKANVAKTIADAVAKAIAEHDLDTANALQAVKDQIDADDASIAQVTEPAPAA